MLYGLLSILLLVFGFGFVIFFHELGHFLAAKRVGIRVDQFAVGFGHAILAWRKGIGFAVGSTAKKVQELLERERAAAKAQPQAVPAGGVAEPAASSSGEAATAPAPRRQENDWDLMERLGIGETEYRLNWIPLGGYVKMLGQDDLRPGADADDPRAYNKKSVGARMFVVSAGVIMNVILAAIGFMVVFLMGFNAPPPVVGSVMPGSPAQEAGLNVGDRILSFDGKLQHDFTKIMLNTALARDDMPTPMEVQRLDGTREQILITPRRPNADPRGFLMLGVDRPSELRGIEQRDFVTDPKTVADRLPADMLAIHPGDTITHIQGEPVRIEEYHRLDQAIQDSAGEPVVLTVKDQAGQTRQVQVRPVFQDTFGAEPLNFAGLVPLPGVQIVSDNSPVRGKVLPGDAIVSLSLGAGRDRRSHLTWPDLMARLNSAGAQKQRVDLQVLRDGQLLTLEDLELTSLGGGRYGLGVAPGYDERHPIVSATLRNSPAEAAGIPAGARITAIDSREVANWFDIQRHLAAASAGDPVHIAVEVGGEERSYALELTERQIAAIGGYRYTHHLLLHNRVEPRKTTNPALAAWWGVTETRDFILQFYLTLQRMFQGSVSYTNMMGPVGIFHAGYTFADRGTDWLIWFLAVISANLAVVNFLPIPIVDGGLFLFLIIEKIKGKPLSQRTQAVAQIVGLAIILSVFLLVTYQDIARLAGF